MKEIDDEESGPTRDRSEEITKRTRAISEVEDRQYRNEMRLLKAEKAVKRGKWWMQIVVGTVAGIFMAGMWAARTWSGVAHKDAVESVAGRVTVVETKVDNVTSDVRWLRDQMVEIARTVRAPMVVQPDHSAPPPAPTVMPATSVEQRH